VKIIPSDVSLIMTEQPYLTVEEVAKRFGVTIRTIYRLAKEGTLPGFRVGKQWRFNKVTLQEWEQEWSSVENLQQENQQGED
jgi:excisionase family DNA binding protein